MPQAINPYAPITVQDTAAESRDADIDTGIGTIKFRAVVDEDCWHRIRVMPRPPASLWLWALALTATSLLIFAVVAAIGPQQPGSIHVPLMILGLVLGAIGGVLFVLYFDIRRTAISPQQIEAHPWLRGPIQGELTSEYLIVHSETVSVVIPRQRIGKLEWCSGALQVHFGPKGIPSAPHLRISLPADGFTDQEETVIPMSPTELPMKENIRDSHWQELIDRLVDTLPEPISRNDWRIPLLDHLRWNDLEWMKERTYLRRGVRGVLVAVLALFVFLWIRAAMLPGTWQPKSDSVSSLSRYSVIPILATVGYLAFYHWPILAGRSLIRIQGMIAADTSGEGVGRRSLICLRSGVLAAAYRGKPTDYAKWTERGLEFWPLPDRLLFFIPARVVPASQRAVLASLFPEES